MEKRVDTYRQVIYNDYISYESVQQRSEEMLRKDVIEMIKDSDRVEEVLSELKEGFYEVYIEDFSDYGMLEEILGVSLDTEKDYFYEALVDKAGFEKPEVIAPIVDSENLLSRLGIEKIIEQNETSMYRVMYATA